MPIRTIPTYVTVANSNATSSNRKSLWGGVPAFHVSHVFSEFISVTDTCSPRSPSAEPVDHSHEDHTRESRSVATICPSESTPGATRRVNGETWRKPQGMLRDAVISVSIIPPTYPLPSKALNARWWKASYSRCLPPALAGEAWVGGSSGRQRRRLLREESAAPLSCSMSPVAWSLSSTALDVPPESAPSAGRKRKGKRKANAEGPPQQSGRAKRPRLMPDPARLATAKQELSMRAAREHIRNESKASGHRAWAATTAKWKQMERQASVRVTSAADGGILPSSSTAAGPSRQPRSHRPRVAGFETAVRRGKRSRAWARTVGKWFENTSEPVSSETPAQTSLGLSQEIADNGVRDNDWERGEVEDKVRELFGERPKWTRAQIEATLGKKRPGDKTMRNIIKMFAEPRGKFRIRKAG
ncbi:hypothetical protein K488DRAFT_69869 [Vararia minispora EC-137]|uniref:Uncharacterized protein n=1 Tax=Vararia minispora EC-137 TaxID=1314806 RepID=A0ACB8QP69_9AGAM|nr:hypothetical protein K488DRAFT_69869 [Vararia minispora EC-137]